MKYKQFTHTKIDHTFESLKAETSEGGRFYSSPVGNMPSVTTVTGWEKSKFFAKWRRENPQESRRVLSRGNAFHSLIEDYLNNKLDLSKWTPETIELFHQLKPELDKIDNIHALEVPL